MDISELIDLFARADSPAILAARWWSDPENSHPRADDVLVEVLGKHGRVSEVAGLRELARLGAAWAARHAARAAALIETLVKRDTPSALVLAAAVSASAGDHRRAAGLYHIAEQRLEADARAFCLLGAARSLQGTDERNEALTALTEAIRESSSARTLNAAGSLLRSLARKGELPGRRRCRIGVVGNVTLDLLVSALETTLFGDGVVAEFWTGGFGQHIQEILDPSSALARFQPEIVVIACDWRVLALPEETPDAAAMVQAKVSEFTALWNACRERLGAHIIQWSFEVPPDSPYGRLSAALSGGMARVLRDINCAFFEAERQSRGLTVVDIDHISGMVGKSRWHAPALWFAARQYPAPEALPELARALAALVRAAVGLTAKCVALDLDGTLWGGVIGEDGVNNLCLGGTGAGEAFVVFQRHLLELKRRGVLLAVCSKNNEADARLPFETHREMVLKLDDISAFVANWAAKDQNLREVARRLNIGLDSIVFVDDNPVERRWIKQQLPEVQLVELPPDPADYVAALERHRPFEALALSLEDRERSETFRGNASREALRATAATVEEFLGALEMTVELRSFDEPNLTRVTQLINKTNQFNLTTRRMQQSQVAALMGAHGVYTQAMRLRDRFGDYGITAVMVGCPEGDALRIDVWLMSCRVMGRRIEEVMLGTLQRHAREAGFARLIGEYIPTAKNVPVQDLYPRLGFKPIGKGSSGGQLFEWDLRLAAITPPTGVALVDLTTRLSPRVG